MRILLHREQLLAMLEEELDDLESDGDHLVFRTPEHMDRALKSAMRSATVNSRPKVVN